MWAARVFLAVLAIAWADRLSAKQYQPETETAFIRPENPVQRVKPHVPCLRPPERPRVEWWMLVGPNGETLIIGAHEVRQRC